VYGIKIWSPEHENNKIWIEESLTDTWSWWQFGGSVSNLDVPPGISYCFKSKIDAGMFTLCRTSSTDGFNSI